MRAPEKPWNDAKATRASMGFLGLSRHHRAGHTMTPIQTTMWSSQDRSPHIQGNAYGQGGTYRWLGPSEMSQGLTV